MHFLHLELLGKITECLTGGTVYTEEGKDVTGGTLIDIFHFITMHSDHPRHLNLLTRTRIHYLHSFLYNPLIHPDISYLTKLGFFQFKSKTNEGLLVVDLHYCFLTIFVDVVITIAQLTGLYTVNCP